jgi:hypothetical protein
MDPNILHFSLSVSPMYVVQMVSHLSFFYLTGSCVSCAKELREDFFFQGSWRLTWRLNIFPIVIFWFRTQLGRERLVVVQAGISFLHLVQKINSIIVNGFFI